MTDVRLVSTIDSFQAKMVVCRRKGKTAISPSLALPRMICALQICTVQQHLYGSSLPSSPSWCGCLCLWTDLRNHIPRCHPYASNNFWCKCDLNDASHMDRKGFSMICQLRCTTLAFHARYVLEVSTEIEHLSVDRDYDVQEKKKRERYTYFRRQWKVSRGSQIINTCTYMYGHTTITATRARKNRNEHFHKSYTLS